MGDRETSAARSVFVCIFVLVGASRCNAVFLVLLNFEKRPLCLRGELLDPVNTNTATTTTPSAQPNWLERAGFSHEDTVEGDEVRAGATRNGRPKQHLQGKEVGEGGPCASGRSPCGKKKNTPTPMTWQLAGRDQRACMHTVAFSSVKRARPHCWLRVTSADPVSHSQLNAPWKPLPCVSDGCSLSRNHSWAPPWQRPLAQRIYCTGHGRLPERLLLLHDHNDVGAFGR